MALTFVCFLCPPALVIALTLTGCTLFAPETRLPAHDAASESYSIQAPAADTDQRWWESFHSNQLNALVEEALGGNFSLKESWARLRQSEALAIQSGAARWPDLSVEAGGSGGGQLPTHSNGDTTYTPLESYRLGVASTYEFDLWGRIRSKRQVAIVSAFASREDLNAAAISLAASVTIRWIGIMSQRMQKKLLQRQLEANITVVDLLELRFRKSLASALDVFQQRQVVEQVRAQMPLAEQQEQRLLNEQALLLGRMPFEPPTVAAEPLTIPQDVPATGLPIQLLSARPDIRAAMLRLEAADWSVSGAQADRLPTIRTRLNANQSMVYIHMTPPEQRQISTARLTQLWRERVGQVSGVESLKFESDAGGPGHGAAMTVELSHRRIDILKRASKELAEALALYPNTVDIDDGVFSGKRQIDFKVRPEAESLGLQSRDIARQVRSAYYGAGVLRQQRGRNKVKVMVRLPKSERMTERSLEQMILRTAEGAEVPLREAVTFDRGRAYTTIERRNGHRVINVSADVRPRSKAGQILAGLKSETLPELQREYDGLTYSFEGRQADRRECMAALRKGMFVALAVIFAMLAVPLNSYIQPLIIMIAIPFGIVGALIGHLIMGYSLSVTSHVRCGGAVRRRGQRFAGARRFRQPQTWLRIIGLDLHPRSRHPQIQDSSGGFFHGVRQAFQHFGNALGHGAVWVPCDFRHQVVRTFRNIRVDRQLTDAFDGNGQHPQRYGLHPLDQIAHFTFALHHVDDQFGLEFSDGLLDQFASFRRMQRYLVEQLRHVARALGIGWIEKRPDDILEPLIFEATIGRLGPEQTCQAAV